MKWNTTIHKKLYYTISRNYVFFFKSENLKNLEKTSAKSRRFWEKISKSQNLNKSWNFWKQISKWKIELFCFNFVRFSLRKNVFQDFEENLFWAFLHVRFTHLCCSLVAYNDSTKNHQPQSLRLRHIFSSHIAYLYITVRYIPFYYYYSE